MYKSRILIADDNPAHLAMVALILQNEGFDPICASDAAGAIQLAITHDPDILLLDVHMGDESGYAIHQKLLKVESLSRKQFIFITGDRSNWMELVVPGSPGRAVLHKPFDQAQLLATIKNLTQASRGGARCPETQIAIATA